MVKVAQVAATNVNTYVITTVATTTNSGSPWLSIPLMNINRGVEGKRTRVDSSEGATFIKVWTNCMSSSKEGKEVCLFLGPSTSRGCTQWWINWENFKWRSLETLRASYVPFLQVLGCSTLQELVYLTTKRQIFVPFIIKHFDQAGLTLIQIYITTNKQTQILEHLRENKCHCCFTFLGWNRFELACFAQTATQLQFWDKQNQRFACFKFLGMKMLLTKQIADCGENWGLATAAMQVSVLFHPNQ